MNDFWVASGHQLLDRNPAGGLVVTDEFLKAFLARPELLPPDEACPVERGLHASLLADPRLSVVSDELAAIADADARENYDVFLKFRDLLVGSATLEQAYQSLFRDNAAKVPPLFVSMLTHVVARNAFDGIDDAFVLRAAECFFRPQRVSFHEGQVLLADQEAIADHEHKRQHSPLLGMLGGPAVTELEVLNETNADSYKSRSDAHDMVLNIASPRGRAAMGEAARVWIRHLAGVDMPFEPADRLDGDAMGWFLAFDAEATRLGNAVWQGKALSPEEAGRILALFRFTLPDDAAIAPAQRGKSAFAVMAATPTLDVRVKPQNLIAGLPLAGAS